MTAETVGARHDALCDEDPRVVRARAETPGTRHVLHLNNAGASLMPAPVLDAVRGYLELEAIRGGYEAQAEQADALDAFYTESAALIGARPDEIAFAPSATRAWQMAFYGVPLGEGDRILTSASAYGSNFIGYLHRAAQTGCSVEVVPAASDGSIDVDALRAMMDERVRLVALTQIPSQSGLINPAAEVGAVAREAGALYLLDACQSVGQVAIDVEAIGCDMLCATGRKYLRGPRGTGFLYVREAALERLEPPFLDMNGTTWVEPDRYVVHDGARRFESWEMHYGGKLGLAVAMRYYQALGPAWCEARIVALGAHLRALLAGVPGVVVQDPGTRQGGIVTFTIDPARGHTPQALKQALAARQINVAIAPTQAALLDMRQRGLDYVLRASVHYYNTVEELARFTGALDELLG